MAERKFLSSVEALGLRTAAEKAAPPPEGFGNAPSPNFGGGAAGALATPLFRYGNRILSALAVAPNGSLEVSALLTDLQKQLGTGFNLSEFLGVIQELQTAGALNSDGRVYSLTDRGRAMAG